MATLDTLQDAVDTLTSSTTALLEEVNVKKATLTSSSSSAASSATSASASAQLAQDWASKTSGTVDGSNYSAKYYATSGPVGTVATNIASVNAVAGNADNINAVASINSSVTSVAGNIGSVNTVSSIVSAVNTNAANSTAITTNATNITSIQNAAANASSAANSATQAAASAASAAAIVTGVSSNRPSVRPSLLLDFANSKQLDPRITFSRPTTASYYDGKTVVKAEENLLAYSQDFDNGWNKASTTITANTATAPDGTNTADSLYETISNSAHFIRNFVSVISGSSYSFSVYAKTGTRSVIRLQSTAGSPSSCFANFNLSTGALGTVGTGCTASISSIGNGWYRCNITYTAASSANADFIINITLSDTDTQFYTYTGDSTQYVYLWGAQLEQRSTITAYTPTTTAPITNYIPALQTAAANVARFDHDPVTGESKGLLIEEQRTNLLTYSDQLDDAVWSKTNSSIASNTIVAPDGTLTGDKIIENSATVAHYVQQTVSVTSGTTYTFSIYAKAAERTSLVLLMAQSTSPFTNHAVVDFNLSNGTIISTSAGSGQITSVGNGWYKCSVTGVASSTGELIRASFATVGNGYSGIYIWGAQLEAGSFPTSYIPTVASQVTRSADSASMTGSNFSSWYRADEGTFYGEYNSGASALPTASDGTGRGVAAISDGTTSNRIRFAQDTWTFSVSVNGVLQASITPSITLASNTNYKFSGCYKFNSFQAARDGTLGTEDTSGSIPIVNQIELGRSTGAGGGNLNGTIKRIAFWPKRLTNSELQGLTS